MFRKGHILTESFVAVIDTMSIAVTVFFCHSSDNSYVVYIYTDHIYHKVIVSSSHHNNTKHMFRKGLSKQNFNGILMYLFAICCFDTQNMTYIFSVIIIIKDI